MKVSELVRKLKKAKCHMIEHGKEHDKWYSPATGRSFMVPRHSAQELPRGTAERIMKDAGLK